VSMDPAANADGGADGGTLARVWRFAHTFSTYTGTTYSDDYYYLFRSYISQNGWFAVFSSDWGNTLGTDPAGLPRRDVFVVELPNPCGP
jgi:hypothetical protein